MSSTNKTTNYELSQYIGSDKPTYLGDYNSDMLKIDAQMKTNADNIAANASAISTASTNATQALSDAAAAQSTANSANTLAGTANDTANTALGKALANEVSISNVDSKLNYSETESTVGTWIDGKPLYRKVIKITNYAKNTLTNVNHNIADIDFIMIKSAFVTMNSTGMTRTINYYQSFSQNTVQAGRVQLNYYCNVTDYDNLFFIIEYTKTTDSAPSA